MAQYQVALAKARVEVEVRVTVEVEAVVRVRANQAHQHPAKSEQFLVIQKMNKMRHQRQKFAEKLQTPTMMRRKREVKKLLKSQLLKE